MLKKFNNKKISTFPIKMDDDLESGDPICIPTVKDLG